MKNNAKDVKQKQQVGHSEKDMSVDVANDLLKQYRGQTEENGDDVHFEHCDWTYNDSSCCC